MRRGMTLVEVSVAAALMLFVIGGVYTMVSIGAGATKRDRKVSARHGALNVASHLERDLYEAVPGNDGVYLRSDDGFVSWTRMVDGEKEDVSYAAAEVEPQRYVLLRNGEQLTTNVLSRFETSVVDLGRVLFVQIAFVIEDGDDECPFRVTHTFRKRSLVRCAL